MTTHKRDESSNLSIIDAVETLASIAEMDFSKEIEIARDNEIFIQNQMVANKTVKWLEAEDPDSTVRMIREVFWVVHQYIKNYYKREFRHDSSKTLLEGIKTIMVLVGEAAVKLDRYTTLFQRTEHKSVRDLKEYKSLQDFYNKKIAKRIDEGVLSRWILGLARQAIEEEQQKGEPVERNTKTAHIFVDLEAVKMDTEYELFQLRKEDGTRFFNPRLIRNIKLVSDFGSIFSPEKGDNPFSSCLFWYDDVCFQAANDLINLCKEPINKYFRSARHQSDREVVSSINTMLVALMMAANPKNLLKNSPMKSSTEYYKDFLAFFRRTLKCHEYQRMILYESRRSGRISQSILQLIDALATAFWTKIRAFQAISPKFEKLLEEARDGESIDHLKERRKCQTLWAALAFDYLALKKALKKHSGGPLKKVLEVLQGEPIATFDPVIQGNLPAKDFDLIWGATKTTITRAPSPTMQSMINKAEVIEEFRCYIRSLDKGESHGVHLLFNFQDRTAWKEYFRATAIEDLSVSGELGKSLCVVTLPSETDFYSQSGQYQHLSNAKEFVQVFVDQMTSTACGFWFPPEVQKVLTHDFLNTLIHEVHENFFEGRNVLSKDARGTFIELVYLLVALKVIDTVRPESVSFTCKDAIDRGPCFEALIFAFCQCCNAHESAKDLDKLNAVLFAPSLMLRERVPIQEYFDRMIATLKIVEGKRAELGDGPFLELIRRAFSRLFTNDLLKIEIV